MRVEIYNKYRYNGYILFILVMVNSFVLSSVAERLVGNEQPVLPVSPEINFTGVERTLGSSCNVITAYKLVEELVAANIDFRLVSDLGDLVKGVSKKYDIMIGNSKIGGLLMNIHNPYEIGFDQMALDNIHRLLGNQPPLQTFEA